MDAKELLELVNQDDARIIAETQLEEVRKQTSLLEAIAAQTKGSLNDHVVLVEVDMNDTHDSYEVYRWREGDPRINSIVILPQLVDYYYEIESGVRIPIDAGLIMDVSGHVVNMLRISNTDTTDDVMKIVLSGVK
jgi:hypothetical protein